MQTKVVRGGPADLIAYAFYTLGYRPRESLVVIGLHGRKMRGGLVVRVDIPKPEHRRLVIGQLAVALRRADEEEAIVLVVSDVGDRPPDAALSSAGGAHRPVPMGNRALAREARRGLRRCGIGVFDVVAVADHAFRSYLCTDRRCCPVQGSPMSTVLGSEMAAQMVLQGRCLADDESSLVADVVADVVADDDNGSLVVAARQERSGGAGDGSAFGLPAERTAALAHWRGLLFGPACDELGRDDIGRLVEALADHRVRDAVLLTLVPGCGSGPEEVLAGGQDDALGALLDVEPDRELLERGRLVLAAVVRGAPAGDRAESLALLAWMAWWGGAGGRARLLVARALQDDPGHRLATLVDQLLLAGVPPSWVTRQRAAQRAGGADAGAPSAAARGEATG